MQKGIAMSLAECRLIYESHFEAALPVDLPFENAARLVLEAVGPDEFVKRIKKARKGISATT